jgi:hypothetical protein
VAQARIGRGAPGDEQERLTSRAEQTVSRGAAGAGALALPRPRAQAARAELEM